ncbi:MAG: CvpA family protein [Candidatus Azobacteroides sp.]|nr:CvpA family protein [Candidatus Azobacteroides sp.]
MNWIDLVIVVVVAIGLIKGLFDGFIQQIISLLSLVLAIFFAGKMARPLRNILMSHESITKYIDSNIVTVICYIIAFTLIILVFRWLGDLLNKTVKVTPISCLNYLLGGFFGAFSSLFFLSLLFNILTIFDSNSTIIKEDAKKESVFFYKVEKLVTFVAPLIKEAHKVKEKIPLLQEKKDNQNETTTTIKVTV